MIVKLITGILCFSCSAGWVAPAFVSLGRSDFAAPYGTWDGIDTTLPNLRIHLFEKSGHWCFLEEQELFDKASLEWARQPAARNN